MLDYFFDNGYRFIEQETDINDPNRKVWVFDKTDEFIKVLDKYFSPEVKAERDKMFKETPNVFRCYSLKLATYLCSNELLYLKECANPNDNTKCGWLYEKTADFYRVFENYKNS